MIVPKRRINSPSVTQLTTRLVQSFSNSNPYFSQLTCFTITMFTLKFPINDCPFMAIFASLEKINTFFLVLCFHLDTFQYTYVKCKQSSCFVI